MAAGTLPRFVLYDAISGMMQFCCCRHHVHYALIFCIFEFSIVGFEKVCGGVDCCHCAINFLSDVFCWEKY